MTRLRDLGPVYAESGGLPAGPHNAITDVAGVRVGHTTLVEGDAVRTGVTVVLPHGGNLFRDKVAAAVHTINGFGKAMGFEQVREFGRLETPIALTNTLNVGLVHDAVVGWMLRENPDAGLTTGTVNPVVGECSDAFLNDIRGRHVHQEHVWAAIESATSGPVTEGGVGAGTGTACYSFKGGIGTASRRVLEGRFTIGALLQTNFGRRAELMVLGVPVGRHLLEDHLPRTGPGSVMVVLATDAPFSARQLGRLARRAAFGLARTGTVCHNGSGDFVIAFSTSNRRMHEPDAIIETVPRMSGEADVMDECFAAVVESVEEAVLNSLLAAETTTGRDGNTLYALPQDRLAELMRHYRRL